jgi:hypothetical protein
MFTVSELLFKLLFEHIKEDSECKDPKCCIKKMLQEVNFDNE